MAFKQGATLDFRSAFNAGEILSGALVLPKKSAIAFTTYDTTGSNVQRVLVADLESATVTATASISPVAANPMQSLECDESENILYPSYGIARYSENLAQINSTFNNPITNSNMAGAGSYKGVLVANPGAFYVYPSPSSITAAATTVGSIVKSVAAEVIPVGVTVTDYVDTTMVDAISCEGYLISTATNARDAIAPLREAFQIEAVESEGKIKFIPRGQPSIIDIPETDYQVEKSNNGLSDAITTHRDDETTLPQTIQVNYMDVDGLYQKGSQYARRLTGKARNLLSIDMPVVFTAQQAARLAQSILYQSWAERTKIQISLSRKYAQLEPTDVITLHKGNLVFEVRLLKLSDDGMISRYDAVVQNTNATTQTVTGSPVDPATTNVVPKSSTRLGILDIAPLDDATGDVLGFYAIASPVNESLQWGGATLYRSRDSGSSYSVVADSVGAAVPMGWATTVLPNWQGGNQVDLLSRVTVKIANGSLASITLDELYAGKNFCIIGDELLQFQFAELIASQTYTLSNFIRGKQGTDAAMLTHAVGDRFAILSNYANVTVEGTALNTPLFYSAITFGVPPRVFTDSQAIMQFNGQRLKPFSPVFGFATKRVSGDIDFAWVRRARVVNYWSNNTDVPLDQATESYRLDIYNGSVIVRSILTLTPAATYTLAQQVTDFGSGQTTLTTKVCQISAAIGDGAQATIILS
jgi:hypothetical protein